MEEKVRERFPIWLFGVYVAYFSGQAIYNTYLNLYMSEIGFSASMIGSMISVSTAVVLAAQTLWGMVSDRVKVKNRVLQLLYLSSGILALCFYLSKNYLTVLVLVTLFTACYVPIVPLNDNITLESLMKSRWDYGWIRMGGTAGYAITVVAAGYFLKDRYSPIFWMVAASMGLCLLFSLRIKPVPGLGGRKRHSSMKEVLSDKGLRMLIAFNLAYGLGTNFFYSFYAIHFVDIGGNSKLVGWMMFACSIAEIPCLMLMRRIVRRIGVDRVLILAGALTTLRWALLFVLKNPLLIIGTNLLHGFGFTGISYCLIHYINRHVPEDLRATSQMLNVTISTVFSKLVFGFIGGLVFEMSGAGTMMACSALVMGAATVVFGLWSRSHGEQLSF